MKTRRVLLGLALLVVLLAATAAAARWGGLPSVIHAAMTGATGSSLGSADTVSARSSPLSAAQLAIGNVATSTTTASGHLIEPESIGSLTVEFRLRNLDAAIAICYDVVTRSGTCAATCAAHTMLCDTTAGATRGKYIPPSVEVSAPPLTGTACLCVESASGTPVLNVEQSQRLPRL